jgi:hypothetical protein
MTTLLPKFFWWSHRNFQGSQAYVDSLEHCVDEDHFKNFPYPVSYCHNSRGYRDAEWPTAHSDLQQSIWCFGDSFTVGYGSPREHTWTYLLEQAVQTRCINVSINGISNEWILRKIQDLVTQVVPGTIVVHWTFTHRRELKEFNLPTVTNEYWKKFYEQVRAPEWPEQVDFEDFHTLAPYIQQEIKHVHYTPGLDKFDFDNGSTDVYDEDRVAHYSNETVEQDTDNLKQCINQAELLAAQHNIKLIHSFIPQFAPATQVELIMQHMQDLGVKFVPVFSRLDLARDGFHYDIKTAQHLVSEITQLT